MGDEGGKGDDGLLYSCLSILISRILSQSLVRGDMERGDSASGCSSRSARLSNEIGQKPSACRFPCCSGSTEGPSPGTLDSAGSELVLGESTKTGVGGLDRIEADFRARGNGVDLKGMG